MCNHSTLKIGFVWNGLYGAGNKTVAVKFCFWTIIANLTNRLQCAQKKIVAAKDQIRA